MERADAARCSVNQKWRWWSVLTLFLSETTRSRFCKRLYSPNFQASVSGAFSGWHPIQKGTQFRLTSLSSHSLLPSARSSTGYSRSSQQTANIAVSG